MRGRLFLILSVACVLTACSRDSHAADDKPAEPAYTFAGTVERGKTIKSDITGIAYPYHVYLPAGYANSDKRYPVMYATDGQWSFPAFSRMLDQRRKPMILISIEQGGPDRRAVDYTVKGEPAYARFLKEELAPLVERTYRTSGVRSYSGTSLGGLLGAAMLAHENAAQPFYSSYLLFDAAFWALTPQDIKIEERRFADSPRLPVKLILSGAELRGNLSAVQAYEARYRSRAYEGLVIQSKSFKVDHFNVGDPSFDWAIDLID
ncbi:MAG: hypothetical protein EOP39_06850 [Rubrivivax sp.]|nr:MAG: hypothetical protein EOP39_06850 [Rubrivivax sp.]